MKNAFYFIFKTQDILIFYHDFLVMQKKRLNQKGKVNLKIYDVTTWLTNNFNTHITQHLKK